MTYLDYDRLDAIDAGRFQATKPFPWLNPEGVLTIEGYQRLLETLPQPAQFQRIFGLERSHGQAPHDRLALEYSDDLDVAAPWHEFVRELRGERYMEFLRRMFGRGFMWLAFHWHYTPNGCSVSPHCDAKRKLGSHIFYFNTKDDWDPAWGGETLILDDGGRFKRKSAPAFEEFDRIDAGEALGNRSLLFARQERSWHGVREIHCPENAYRKVFIVVIDDWARHVLRRGVGILRGETHTAY